MRRSRESELLELLSRRRKGFTWGELIAKRTEIFRMGPNQVIREERIFPRQTLAPLLKALIQKGMVERIPEPKEKGERGHPSSRYRIPEKYWFSWGCLVMHLPAKWIGQRFFLGQWRPNPHDPSKEHVRLFPAEALEYREHQKHLKTSRGHSSQQ